MASLDNLPADQRAVLQLVLQRDRGYDEIARLLSMDRAAVRERALNAFDALGPQTGVGDQRRALITDYLLGQLPPAVAREVRDHLGESPSERAWARVLASELGPLTSRSLPEIPVESAGSRAAADAGIPAAVGAGAAAAATGSPPAPGKSPSGRQSIFRRRRP
ncbi:MAG: zf-HC2 domain-containing protein, partial [Actinomycetota bacterium]|nr:zf-HC2 domain-containing protein [Actinomycetota bacterium]